MDALTNTISFAYDENGNQRFLTDGNTNTTEFVYDGLNRKVKTIYPGTSYEEAGYDFLGNRTSRKDAKAQSTTYVYDDRNRLDHVFYESGKERDYQYDKVGNLTNVVENAVGGSIISNACVSYSYDSLNRMKTETSVGVLHTYQYDLNGNRTNAIYGITGREVSWNYDALNRINAIVEGTNTTAYRYDLNSNPVGRTYPNGVFETRDFDALNRLEILGVSKGENSLLNATYSYDAVGSAREMTQTSSGVGGSALDAVYAWKYDDRYRLTNETVIVDDASSFVTNATTFSWDAADNRLEKRTYADGVLQETTEYTPNALNQMVGWTSGTTEVFYGFDANGNRTNAIRTVGGSPATTSYTYDEDNRLIAVALNNATSNTHTFAYDYRTRRYYRSTPLEKTLCVFDGGLSVQEYNVSGRDDSPQSSAPAVEYLRGPDMGGGVGGMVYSTRAGTNTYSHANHRGDVLARTSSLGELTWVALYEAYGKRMQEQGANPDRQKANTKEEEADLNLLFEGMRPRDLETGVWLAADPIGYADGLNRYCFVHGNPITRFDPLGLNGMSPWDMDRAARGHKPFESTQTFTRQLNDAGTLKPVAASIDGVMSLGRGAMNYSHQLERRLGTFGEDEKKWARFEDKVSRTAVRLYNSDEHFRTTLNESIKSKTLSASAEGVGKFSARLATSVGVTGVSGGIGGFLGPMATVGDGTTAMENATKKYLRDYLTGDIEFGSFKYSYDLRDKMTPEVIEEYLKSEQGQQFISETFEAVATGETSARATVSVDKNGIKYEGEWDEDDN